MFNILVAVNHRLKGYVDTANCNVISGWASNEDVSPFAMFYFMN